MLARRVIALSPDKAFAKQLGTALKAAGGAVEVHTALDALGRGELQAALVVLHVEGALADEVAALAARLPDDGRLIVVLPKPDLARAIALMQSTPRLAGVLVADHFRSSDLSSMATRVLAGDIFGLEKLVPWGTKIYSQLVGDYQEKSLCIAQVSEFAELMGVRRKYREAVEQVVDEMLMNALYDAPVDDQGKQIFADIPTKTRISLRMEQKVVVQYACDDRAFYVSVRDSYGTLDRATVVRYIDKCLHSEQQIDRKTGGAGLGLYLMANSTSRMYFNVLPGIATEAVCTFHLDSPKVQLEAFGFFQERIDAAGRLAAGPSRLLPPGVGHPVERRQGPRPTAPAPASSRGVALALALAVAALLAVIGVVAYPRFLERREQTAAAPHDAAPVPPDAPRPAVVRLDSDPPGATVLLGDEELGTTPLETTSFAAGSRVEVVLRKNGYVDETVAITAPEPGASASITRELAFAPEVASIVITSEPPGAEVTLDGQPKVGVVTPTDEILVQAGKPHVIGLALDGYLPVEVKVTPGRGARGVPVRAKLQKGIALDITSNLDARVTVDGVPGCARQATPLVCTVPKGSYDVELRPKLGGKITRRVKVTEKAAELAVEFELGIVEAPDDAKLLVDRKEVDQTVLEVGKRLVTVVLADGTMMKAEVKVDPRKPVKAKVK